MGQGRAARDAVVVEVWGKVRAKVEVEWADHLQQGQAETVFAQAVELPSCTLQDSLVIRRSALNVEQ